MRLPKDIVYILHDQEVMTLYHFVEWGRPGGCTLDWEADTFAYKTLYTVADPEGDPGVHRNPPLGCT